MNIAMSDIVSPTNGFMVPLAALIPIARRGISEGKGIMDDSMSIMTKSAV
jgi:hypothetical protein